MSTEPLIAVFIDYENLAIGVRDMKPKQKSLDIELVLSRLLKRGRVVFKRAYCDWSHYKRAARDLHELGVSLVDIPQKSVGAKNSADIAMVVDALDMCFSREHINVFALLTGDSDFSPLVSKLRECDKRVFGCGVKSSTSNLLVSSCDDFLYYDDLVDRAATRRRRPAGKQEQAPSKDDALEMLMEVIRSLDEDYENVWGSMVKQAMGRVNPGFSHAAFGYATFTAMLREAEKRGHIEVEMDRTRGNVRVQLRE